MKKWILFSLLASSALFAEETIKKDVRETSPYLDVGAVMLPIPVIGVGFRTQANHIGFDASVKSAILVLPLGLRENASVLYYPTPNLSSQYYFGAGASASQTFSIWSNGFEKYYFGPSVLFGNSYRNSANDKRFWQIGTDLYFQQKKNSTKFIPLPIIYFSYGFGF